MYDELAEENAAQNIPMWCALPGLIILVPPEPGNHVPGRWVNTTHTLSRKEASMSLSARYLPPTSVGDIRASQLRSPAEIFLLRSPTITSIP